jgi:hypothetical protein
MESGFAVSAKLVPVIPGAAACAEPSSSNAAAALAARNSRLFMEVALFVVGAFIVAP